MEVQYIRELRDVSSKVSSFTQIVVFPDAKGAWSLAFLSSLSPIFPLLHSKCFIVLFARLGDSIDGFV